VQQANKEKKNGAKLENRALPMRDLSHPGFTPV